MGSFFFKKKTHINRPQKWLFFFCCCCRGEIKNSVTFDSVFLPIFFSSLHVNLAFPFFFKCLSLLPVLKVPLGLHHLQLPVSWVPSGDLCSILVSMVPWESRMSMVLKGQSTLATQLGGGPGNPRHFLFFFVHSL